ncbi:MAG TPA: hypothetical protein VNZ52_06085 [Candidatus Thermoplasmatota archaeon]|nr:hypothetical protein [Candidatus Thermoplasmatota archaeon]
MDFWRTLLWVPRLILVALILIRLDHLRRGKQFAREELTNKPSSDVPYLLIEGAFLAASFTVVEPFFGWVGTGPLPLAAANFFFLMSIVIHELGHALRLYESMIFHFSAHTSISFCIGVQVYFGLFQGAISLPAYFTTAGIVFAVGVVWEYLEMYGTEYMDTQAWYHNWDMVLDIVGNTLGGLLAVLLAHAMLTGIVPVG